LLLGDVTLCGIRFAGSPTEPVTMKGAEAWFPGVSEKIGESIDDCGKKEFNSY
jgi:hypothetical protein